MSRGPQCRYSGKYQRCGAEAVDPAGEILLCHTHLALALELLQRRGAVPALATTSKENLP